MLEPTDRNHLWNALKAPEGYELHSAIGTTYSLDLLTLLTIPLAFTVFSQEGGDGAQLADPLAVLAALRGHSEKITIFCQAGQISIPKPGQQLYSYLESMVVEVTPPGDDGVFHPKVWLLRFQAGDGSVRYRLLCSTRNITFDRFWDTMLVLEGELNDKNNSSIDNGPLTKFIHALPEMASHKINAEAKKRINRMERELRRVPFELPEGFEEMTFWPLGIPGLSKKEQWPFDGRRTRTVVVSPFLSARCLRQLSKGGHGNVLISRLESLDALTSDELEGFEQLYILDSTAHPEDSDFDEEENAPIPLEGLHAKLYIADDGWNARIWTGSANATDAAFNKNVEFLVELKGKKSFCGTAVFLQQEKNKTNVRDLLQVYEPGDEGSTAESIEEELEKLLRKAVGEIVEQQLIAKVSTPQKDCYTVTLSAQKKYSDKFLKRIHVQCWPISLKPVRAVEPKWSCKKIATFKDLSFEALTSFYAFEINMEKEGKQLSKKFVMNVPLQGVPADREKRILQSLVKNKEDFLRFLFLILSEGGLDMSAFLRCAGECHSSEGIFFGLKETGTLFELLVKTLHRNPEQLDRIHRLKKELMDSDEGAQLLPEGFDTLWKALWGARRGLTG